MIVLLAVVVIGEAGEEEDEEVEADGSLSTALSSCW